MHDAFLNALFRKSVDDHLDFSGETLEEAVNKLAAKAAILMQNPDHCLLFTWDD